MNEETEIQPNRKEKHGRFVMKEQLNLNTVLLTIVLAIGAWSLKETISQGRDFVALQTKMESIQANSEEAQRRIAAAEAAIVEAKLELVRLRIEFMREHVKPAR